MRIILCSFCFGLGSILGWMLSNWSIQAVVFSFFTFIGFIFLGVLVYAAAVDDPEAGRSYPKPETWAKKFQN